MKDSPRTILIVEDDPGHVALLKRQLDGQPHGYELAIARNLAEAHVCLREQVPDLVMTDLVLPDGSGIELLDGELQGPQVPMVVMTSQGNEQTAVEALKRGALDYLVKTDEMFNDIQHVIERALREWHHIREKKRAEQRLRQRDAELAHMSRVSSMGEMAAALAHELNQPLGTIANLAGTVAHLIQKGNLAERDLLNSIEQINEQALNAGQIIRRLKRFVSQTVPNRVHLDINDLVMDVLHLMKSTTQQHQVRIATELDPALPNVLGDRIQIQQVLVNLMSNAFEAMESTAPALREVVIRTKTLDESVQISVSDCGCGLTEEQSNDAFEPYVTTKEEGLGMGLAIIRRIIKAHCGEISATQNPAGGATFVFNLPGK